MLDVSVNNKNLEVQDNCTLSQLIHTAGFAEQSIAIAINGEFVPKSLYKTTHINNADQIDIVKPIGGG